MHFAPEHIDASYVIRAIGPTSVQVNELALSHSFIISPMRLINPWTTKDVESLTQDDLAIFFELKPSVIILGVGQGFKSLPAQWLMPFYEQKIGVEIMSSASACRTYNILAGEQRNVAAGILLPG